MKEESWRNLGGESIEEAIGRYLGGVWEIFKVSGRHLGGIWEASGRHVGGVWEAFRRHKADMAQRRLRGKSYPNQSVLPQKRARPTISSPRDRSKCHKAL